jgi:hypothetical protein
VTRLGSGDTCRPPNASLLEAYIDAKCVVFEQGFESEVAWQEGLCFGRLTESDFLREAAWVILSSGFRERVVRRCFPGIAEAFLNFSSSAAIADKSEECVASAMTVFRQRRKVAAIAGVAVRVARQGFESVRGAILEGGVEYLESFPYVGPVTRYHLAKNVGLDVVKPDRHLCRVAKATRYPSVEALCRAISCASGDRVGVVDLVIWRYATLDERYVEHFQGRA